MAPIVITEALDRELAAMRGTPVSEAECMAFDCALNAQKVSPVYRQLSDTFDLEQSLNRGAA